MSNPKFEETILVVDKESGDRPSSNKKKKSTKIPPPKVKRADKPKGRDMAKASMQADILVSKVSKEVAVQLQQNEDPTPRAVNLNVFKEGLEKANENMSTIADMLVMAMAQDDIKQKYFPHLFGSKLTAIANKKAEQELQKLQLQNKRERLEIESKELRQRKKKLMDTMSDIDDKVLNSDIDDASNLSVSPPDINSISEGGDPTDSSTDSPLSRMRDITGMGYATGLTASSQSFHQRNVKSKTVVTTYIICVKRNDCGRTTSKSLP